MRWTKDKSRRAVEAKARLRMARAAAEPSDLYPNRVKLPRFCAPDFTIRIESARGERICFKIRRFNGRVFINHGQSVRQFCRGLEHLITKSA